MDYFFPHNAKLRKFGVLSWHFLLCCLTPSLVLKFKLFYVRVSGASSGHLWFWKTKLYFCVLYHCVVSIHVSTWMFFHKCHKSGSHWWDGLPQCVSSHQNLLLLFHKLCNWMPWIAAHFVLLWNSQLDPSLTWFVHQVGQSRLFEVKLFFQFQIWF